MVRRDATRASGRFLDSTLSMTFRIRGAVLAAAPLAITACGTKTTQQRQPPVPVAVTRVARAAVPFNLTADGTVEPMQTAYVQAQVGGILTHVTFKEGDDVQAGQVLFQIDPAPYRATLDQASAALARDEATAANAQKEAERYGTLVKKDYVTQEQADQQLATYRAAAAAVKADSAMVESARINLGWTTIRAPISGRAGQLLVRQGNLVRGGTQQPLVLINQIRPILVHFSLPATSLPAVQRYAAAGPLAVRAVPGLPPNTTAQPTSTGPTPAYTTDPSSDAAAADPAASNTVDDGAGAPGGRGRAGRGGGQSPSGPPSGPSGGPPSGPPLGSTSGTSAAGPDAPGSGRAAGSGMTGQGGAGSAASVGSPGSSFGQSGGETGSGMRGAGSRPAGGSSSGSMPGLPGVPAPAPVQGTLTFIDNQVDTTTGTVLLKGTFPNQAGTLWPGQFVATTLRLFVQQNALVVPAQAVMTGQQGNYVYLVDASGTARQRPVTVERTSANVAVIASGLAEGDQVVTDGQSRLTPGAKVNVRGLVPPGAGGVAAPGAGTGSG